MARFDKKWLLVHVPAGIAVVALMAFGVVQCNGNEEYSEELAKASAGVKQARQALESNVATMDSLIDFNKALLKINVAQADSIVVLNDSIDTLNGRVVDLTNKNDSLVNANDSLVVALDDCAKSKKQKTAKSKQDKPKVAPVYSPKPVKSETQEKQLSGETVVLPGDEVTIDHGAKNNGNIVVENRGGCPKNSDARSVTITLDNNAENNGNIVVGNGNTVTHTTILPDTVVRFTRAKNTVVKCRVIATQRQYR